VCVIPYSVILYCTYCECLCSVSCFLYIYLLKCICYTAAGEMMIVNGGSGRNLWQSSRAIFQNSPKVTEGNH
jgi:hypothetical protein